jgi:hypothetical protein
LRQTRRDRERGERGGRERDREGRLSSRRTGVKIIILKVNKCEETGEGNNN